MIHAALAALLALLPPPDLATRLDESVQRHGLGQFWGAVLVAKDGEPILARGYGLADESLRPIDADTLFDLGSLSKQFTAAAVLKLHAQGRLNIDAPVAEAFPTLAAKFGPRGGIITLRHLLNHTSGMSDQRAIQPLDFAERDEAVRLAVVSGPDSPPGEQFQYCNAGYIVLAAAVEHATGERFEDYCRENLFRPAGMTSTGFLDGAGLDSSRATLRVIPSFRGEPERRLSLFADAAGEPWAWGLRGAGGVVSTINDLLRWDRALEGKAVLDERIKAELFRTAKNNYAAGWVVEPTAAGTIRQQHGGNTRGYSVQLSRFPEEGYLFAVLTNNTSNPVRYERLLIEQVFPDERAGIRASLHVGGLTLNQYGLFRGEGAYRVSAAPGPGREVALRLEAPGGELLVEASFARGMARRVAAELRAQTPDALPHPDEPGSMTVMIGTMAYQPRAGRIDLPESSVFMVLPEYRGVNEHGAPVTDARPTLVLIDENRGFWPMILIMDRAVAARLASELLAE